MEKNKLFDFDLYASDSISEDTVIINNMVSNEEISENLQKLFQPMIDREKELKIKFLKILNVDPILEELDDYHIVFNENQKDFIGNYSWIQYSPFIEHCIVYKFNADLKKRKLIETKKLFEENKISFPNFPKKMIFR